MGLCEIINFSIYTFNSASDLKSCGYYDSNCYLMMEF